MAAPNKPPRPAAPAPRASPPTPARTPSSPHGTLAWLAVVRVYNLCDAVMSARLAEHGVRVGEHEVLATLATAPGLTQQELALRCFVTKSGVSMLLSQMEAQGLVLRDADGADARVKRLFLSRAGQALAAKTLKVQFEVVSAMAEGIADAEMTTVASVMQRVAAQLEALRAVPAPLAVSRRTVRARGPSRLA